MEDERSEESGFEYRSSDVEQERTWGDGDEEPRNDSRREEVPFHVPRD